MPKNKASHAHDLEYIIPAPLEMVIESLEALPDEDWYFTKNGRDEDSYQFQLVRKLSPNKKYYVGGIGQAIRYEGTDTLVQLRYYGYRDQKANNGRNKLSLLLLGLFALYVLIYPPMLLVLYVLSLILCIPTVVIVVLILITRGLSSWRKQQGYDVTDDRIRALAQIALEMLQNHHKREFSKIILFNREQPEISRLVDNLPSDLLTDATIQETYYAQK